MMQFKATSALKIAFAFTIAGLSTMIPSATAFPKPQTPVQCPYTPSSYGTAFQQFQQSLQQQQQAIASQLQAYQASVAQQPGVPPPNCADFWNQIIQYQQQIMNAGQTLWNPACASTYYTDPSVAAEAYRQLQVQIANQNTAIANGLATNNIQQLINTYNQDINAEDQNEQPALQNLLNNLRTTYNQDFGVTA